MILDINAIVGLVQGEVDCTEEEVVEIIVRSQAEIGLTEWLQTCSTAEVVQYIVGELKEDEYALS